MPRFFYTRIAVPPLLISALFFAAVPIVVADVVDERKRELERELAELEVQIQAQRELLESKQRESTTLERDIAILDAKIRKAQLSIQARNLSIEKLRDGIQDKEATIGELGEKLERQKESLAQLIRRTNETDGFTLVEVVLSGRNISEFFESVDSYVSINSALNESFRDIEVTAQLTAEEKAVLESRQAQQEQLRTLQVVEKRRIEEQEDEKQTVLRITKGQEASYQEVLKSQEKTAAQIRAELFALRGSAAIPFGEALALAERASAQTGVRPAFILGIIAEESNLGENVGTGNWREDMHPTRDQPVFEEITARLGLDPDTMPVSKKPWYGWGGAMGPAQFIPSTWILFEKQIAQLTGNNPPNPWDPEDAFMASAVLLKDNGASRGGYANERLAALRYFAGWANANKPAYAFYGDDVMSLTEKYQRQINILNS